MKNKKGFTLIEVLATITIMSLISLMVSFNITNFYQEKEKEDQENQKEIIETAACVYINLEKNKELQKVCKTSGCKINTDELINNKLLDKSIVNNNKVINIHYKENESICKLEE